MKNIPRTAKFCAFVFFLLCVFAPLRDHSLAKARRRKAQLSVSDLAAGKFMPREV